MQGTMTYSYLDTRVSLMAGQLLSDESILHFIEKRNPENNPGSFTGAEQHIELVDRLSNAIGMDDKGIDGIDRGMMPKILSELSIFMRALYREDRELLRFWAWRFELANIKTLLRGKMCNCGDPRLYNELVDLGPFSQINLEKLILSSDTAEVLRQLEDSVYADFAREMRLSLRQQHELFTIDASIDRRYFSGLATRARSVGGEARLIVGNMIDRVNLVWLLRYRFNYELPAAQAFYLLIPSSHILSHETLMALTRMDSLTQVLEAVPEPFNSLLQGATSISEVTRRLEQNSWNTAKKVLKGRRFNPTRALAYMILRERDLRRVRAIERGHRLQIDPRMIMAASGLQSIDEMTTIMENAA